MIKITLFDLLKPSDVIHINLLRDNLMKDFKCSIYKVIDDDIILISSPIDRGRLFSLHAGESVAVIHNKENTGVYNFYANVVSIKKVGELSAVVLKKSSNIKKTQRRDYFRLSYFEDFRITRYNIENDGIEKEKYKVDKNGIIIEEYEDEKKYFILSGRDLSAGGFRGLSDEKFSVGEYVEGIFRIGRQKIEFKAKVIRSDSVYDPIYKYESAFEFYNLDDKIRAEIVSFIFIKERKLRSEELMK